MVEPYILTRSSGQPRCKHCHDDPPFGHTCPVCGHLPEYDATGERLWPADVPSRPYFGEGS